MNNIYKATQLIGDTYAKQMIGENEYIQSWHVHKLKHTFAVASNIMDLLFSEKEIFEKFDDCYAELTDINEREIFVYAFRLGAKIAIEIMTFETK